MNILKEKSSKNVFQNILTQKNKLLIFLVLFILLVIIGASFAIWQLTLKQGIENVISSSCFSIILEETEGSDIHMSEAFPIVDEEGTLLSPYKFKIKNNCNAYAKFSIALETINTSTLNEQYLKVKLNEDKASILNSNPEATPILKNASKAYILDSWYLEANEEKIYNLRLWLDENAPASDEVMNQTWSGKVTINANYLDEALKAPGMLRSVTYYDIDGMWEYRDSISKIVIQNELMSIDGSIKTTDESVTQDKSVMSYVVPNEDGATYTAYLQSNRKLILNSISFALFANFSKVKEIEGMKYVDTTNVTKMDNMFYGMGSLTSLDLSNFDTSKVTDMFNMFGGCSNLTSLDISSFNTSQVARMGNMFYSCSKLTNLDLSNFDTSKVTNMVNMFCKCSNLTSLDVSSFNTSQVVEMDGMFYSCSKLTNLDLSNLDTSKVTNMQNMFSGCSNLTSLDISSFNTSQVVEMDGMFNSCSKLTNLDLSNFDTSKVTTMQTMFSNCSALTSLELGNNFDTSNVTDMDSMFNGLTNLKVLELGEKFNTSKVTKMPAMFKACSSLERLDLSSFDTSNVTTMWEMFTEMTNLKELNITSFNTSKVEYMVNMFFRCRSLERLDLSSFDTSNVTNMLYMFSGSIKLSEITYGNNFIHKTDANIDGMYVNCPANKPTDSSWDGLI